jgi:putative transposase
MAQSRGRTGIGILWAVAVDMLRLIFSVARSHSQLAAEHLFLRKQLAFYVERPVRPRRADDATRITLSSLIEWRRILMIVKPDTLIGWHRKGFRLFWRRKSKPRGRPRLPSDLRQVIREIATANRTWGEERIAAELLLKVGLQVSPRTVRRYMRHGPGPRRGPGMQDWSTFLRNHVRAILACDFFMVVTATFRVFYVFVVLELSTRQILHWNVTDHPTAEWTAQQFRMVVPSDQLHRFVIHDRDSIYAEGVDKSLRAMGLRVLKTPVRVPQANAHCERLIGTIRRECLDFVIPLNERHLRRVLTEWVTHYNQGRPHTSLGPGLPDPPSDWREVGPHDHRIPAGHEVRGTPVLGGLHHEYRLIRVA